MKSQVAQDTGRNVKIIIFTILFLAWGFLVGYSKAFILYTGYPSEGDSNLLECTYFNGFVIKTVKLRDLKSAGNEGTCPGLIDNGEIGGWTP